MQKSILLLFLFIFTLTSIIAQSGSKSLKLASKSMAQYTKDPFNNQAALAEAKDHLEVAFEDEEVRKNPKSWLTRGDLYYNIGDSQIKSRLLNPEFEITLPNTGIESFHSYVKALEMAEKKGEVKNAITGIGKVGVLINSMGIEMYRDKDYATAHQNFVAEIEAGKLLIDRGRDAPWTDDAMLAEKYYFAGITGSYSDFIEESIEYLKQAKALGTNEPTLYQVLYESYNKLDKTDEGLLILNEGRKAFPDDSGLLFLEINYYLANDKLDEMISKLEEARQREPDNLSVILTMGQVYDKLQVKANEEGDDAKAQEHFLKAHNFYEDALIQNPDNFDLNYSLGALYYNKAASLTDDLNDVANDFSPAGTKKYDKIKKEMTDLFDKALPYFLTADQINVSDRNTIIALKEIYARKDNFDRSNEYKMKLEALVEKN